MELFKSNIKIILASGSPRRKDFLTDLGMFFNSLPAGSPEPRYLNNEQPGAFAMRVASLKAREVYARLQATIKEAFVVIGADTVVALGDKVMGKPTCETEALDMLKQLGGKVHSVYTGCCCLFSRPECGSDRESEEVFFEESKVWMHRFPDAVLSAYIRSGEPMDKAGAYAIQGKGAFLIEKVEGSWTNIVGLPLGSLIRIMLGKSAISPV